MALACRQRKVTPMRTFNIARKTLLELIREPKMLGLMLVFPAMLIGIYYIAFGNSEAGMSAFLRLLVINQDAGTMGSDLIETLRASRYDNKPVFAVDVLDSRETAENTLRERRASALIIIPPDFSQSIADKRAVKLERVGDATYDYFVFA